MWRDLGNKSFTNIYSSNLYGFKIEVGSSFHLWHLALACCSYAGKDWKSEALTLPEVECKVIIPWFVKTQSLSGGEVLKRSWLTAQLQSWVWWKVWWTPKQRTMWVPYQLSAAGYFGEGTLFSNKLRGVAISEVRGAESALLETTHAFITCEYWMQLNISHQHHHAKFTHATPHYTQSIIIAMLCS